MTILEHVLNKMRGSNMRSFNYIFVAIGGFLGAGLRYGISIIFHYPTPLASTFIVNILGSLLIGLVFGITQKKGSKKWLWPLWGTGFCGGFTTMSTFSMETIHLWQKGSLLQPVLYIAITLMLGIVSTILGIYLVTLKRQISKKGLES
jgi:CrcB protein